MLVGRGVEIGKGLAAPDDFISSGISRRTVTVGTNQIVLDGILDVNSWYNNLSTLPSVENCDILIYFLKYCGWCDDRLKNYKHDSGYRLYCSNHIGNVVITDVLTSLHHVYVKAECVPETRQQATPYNVWVILEDNGRVVSGGCTCVA